MDVSILSTIISDLGFPIAVCVALFWHNEKQAARHREEVAQLAEALNNNTAVMQELVGRLNYEQ